MTCQTFKKKVSAYMVMKAASALLLERGYESSKLGGPDVGTPRADRSDKDPAKKDRRQRRRSRDEGSASKNRHLSSGHRPTIGIRDGTKTTVVCAQFFDYMTGIATAAMGPMAHLVLRDQIAALGESQDAFPRMKLRQLVDLVSREILNETMRDRFKDMMLQEMDALQPLRG